MALKFTVRITFISNVAKKWLENEVALSLVYQGEGCPAWVQWDGPPLRVEGDTAIATISVMSPDMASENYEEWWNWISSIKENDEIELQYTIPVAYGKVLHIPNRETMT